MNAFERQDIKPQMNISRAKLFFLWMLCMAAGWMTPSAGAMTQTNSLVWQADRDLVSADIRGEPLWPLLEDIAHQTGWHIFVEPRCSHVASVKFKDVRSGEALRKLLGNLNYALVPQTNGPQQLYIFTTIMQNATQRVRAPSPKPAQMKHVPNQLVVKLKPGVNIDMLAKIRGAKVVSRNDKLGIYLLEFPDAASTDAALAGLRASPDVASVDYNYLFDPPTNPQMLASVPPGAEPFRLSLEAGPINDPCNPVIGLIDTGMQSLGKDLDPFILPGTNVTGQASALSSTVPTHGTAMAAAMLRAMSQQQGGKTSARILPVNVYGSGETASTWNVALGVQAAVDGGVSVLNMSLSGTTDDLILNDIIKQAIAKGVVVFAAAGNQPVDTPNYPAAIPGVNAVTALGAPGQLAPYANYGSFVSLALPGTSVVTLGNQTFAVQGTSSATAYASGIAAALKSANCLPWNQIESAMGQRFPMPSQGN